MVNYDEKLKMRLHDIDNLLYKCEKLAVLMSVEDYARLRVLLKHAKIELEKYRRRSY